MGTRIKDLCEVFRIGINDPYDITRSLGSRINKKEIPVTIMHFHLHQLNLSSKKSQRPHDRIFTITNIILTETFCHKLWNENESLNIKNTSFQLRQPIA